jgi:hypothetical protein
VNVVFADIVGFQADVFESGDIVPVRKCCRQGVGNGHDDQP